MGDGCQLYLGSSGKTKRSGFISSTGIFDFDSLTVAAGGVVTATSNLVGADNKIKLAVSFKLFWRQMSQYSQQDKFIQKVTDHK